MHIPMKPASYNDPKPATRYDPKAPVATIDIAG
jgi:hypothetical protein